MRVSAAPQIQRRPSSGHGPSPSCTPWRRGGGFHPLGPGLILHLGGSSPPKIKFLQHPSSFESPQVPIPENPPPHALCRLPGPSQACWPYRSHHTTQTWEHTRGNVTRDRRKPTAAHSWCGESYTPYTHSPGPAPRPRAEKTHIQYTGTPAWQVSP